MALPPEPDRRWTSITVSDLVDLVERQARSTEKQAGMIDQLIEFQRNADVAREKAVDAVREHINAKFAEKKLEEKGEQVYWRILGLVAVLLQALAAIYLATAATRH